MIDFKELLDKEIEKDIEHDRTRERSGKFSPSSMGKCFRYQILRRAQVPESDSIPIEVYRKFRAGKIYHKDLQSLVPDETVEVEYEDEDFKCYADYVGEDCVVDFKTVFLMQFKKMKGMSNEDIIKDKKQYVMQIMTYCKFLNKPTGWLVFVNKDDYDIIQVKINYCDWEKEVESEIEMLKNFWTAYKSKAVLPVCYPRCYVNKKLGKSMEKQYCGYRSSEICKGCK